MPEDTQIQCRKCGYVGNKEFFTHQLCDKKTKTGICRYCDWLSRHGDVHKQFDDWEKEDFLYVVKSVLLSNEIIVNDLQQTLQNKTINDIAKLTAKLHLNRQIKIRTQCECCGETIYKTPTAFFAAKNNYCSPECYWKHKKSHAPSGDDHPQYNRVETQCTECGKKILVIPSKMKQVNSFGEHAVFCSRDCYSKYRSHHYVGEKSAMFHKQYTNEELDKIRKRLTENRIKATRLDSKPQLILNDILNKMDIKYEREYVVGYYSIDNYLPDYGLMIEVMGDYWHGNPTNRYNMKSLTHSQDVGIINDKQKKSYVYNHCKINILYLWEKELIKSPELCEKLILLYVNSNGVLTNYHSFNYIFDENNRLTCLQNPIVPYQDMKRQEYLNIINQ